MLQYHPRVYFCVCMLTERWTAHLTAVHVACALAASPGIGARPIIRIASIRAACYLRPLAHAYELSWPRAHHANAIASAVNTSYDNHGGGHRKLLPLLGLTLIV